MKKLITNYTFDASAKQVVFTDYNPVSLAGILLITNVTDNVIIYNFADPNLGGTVATTTLTLTYDTTLMDDADKLQIFYDDGVATSAVTQSGTWDEVGINDSGNSITVDNGGTFATQATLAAETTKVIGTVNVAASQTIAATQGTAANLNMTEASASAIKTAVEAVNTKMVTGTDIGDVTINNSAGASAVNIQDGGNTITVDGTVLLGANSGVDIGKLTANQSVNNAQINGVTPLMGAGNTGTGSQRVTIATDQAAVASKAAINTYVDGSIVTIGAKADAKSTATDTTAVTLMQVTKQISASVQAPPFTGIEDAAETAGGSLAMMGSVRRDTPASSAGASGDNATLNTDSTGGLYTTHNITAIGHGVKTVTTAGTDLALAASTPCKKVDIQAMNDNTGVIAVGGSGVDATLNSGTGVILYAGDIYCLEIDNLADVYIDATVSGNKVRFTYYS